MGGHAALRFTVRCDYSTVSARLETWTQRFTLFAVKHVDEE